MNMTMGHFTWLCTFMEQKGRALKMNMTMGHLTWLSTFMELRLMMLPHLLGKSSEKTMECFYNFWLAIDLFSLGHFIDLVKNIESKIKQLHMFGIILDGISNGLCMSLR